MSEAEVKEKLREFAERRVAVLRSRIEDLQRQFKASVANGADNDGESSRLYAEAALLRLQYTELRAEFPRGGRWVALDERVEFPPPEVAGRRPLGFQPHFATKSSQD